MERLKLFAIWLTERGFESGLVSFLAVVYDEKFGARMGGPYTEEFTTNWVLFVASYFYSFYGACCVYVGLVNRPRNPLFLGAILALCFCVNILAVFSLARTSFDQGFLLLILVCALGVLVAHLIVSPLYLLIGKVIRCAVRWGAKAFV